MEATNPVEVFKLFLPTHIMNEITSYNNQKLILVGFAFKSTNAACITDSYNDYGFNSNYLQTGKKEANGTNLILGLIKGQFGVSVHLPKQLQKHHVFSVHLDEYGAPECQLKDSFKESMNIGESMVILYDVHQLRKSSYISEENNENDLINTLVKAYREHDKVDELTEKQAVNIFDSGKNIYRYVVDCIYKCLLFTTDVFLKIVGKLRFERLPMCDKLCSQPAVFEQLKRKHDDRLCVMNRYEKQKYGIHNLRMKNLVWKNMFDVCLGLILMCWFISNTSYSDMVADSMMKMAQLAATELQMLLKWMMGVPAGLKLNTQLDQFLGKFFLYHIYLWTAYLNFLKPVLSSTLWYISLSGCLGLSVQVALVQDLLSMMTLHIYCFYVYAARLYNFQMSGLSSLWRFFRGKKWNALRQRVDHAQYDVDQLFIGTLLFTILLFLLPTAILYYVVFLGLRLLVLFIQGSLYKVISVINNTPLYLFLLKLWSPETLANDVEFHVMRQSRDNPYLVMQLKAASMGQLLRDGCMQGPRVQKHSWGDFIHKIIAGHLVYPWLDRNNS